MIRYRIASTPWQARTPNLWILWKSDCFFSRKNSQPFKAKTNRCASGNDPRKEKIALKEHNSALAHMIANLNSYITQLRSSPPSDNIANPQHVASALLQITMLTLNLLLPPPIIIVSRRSPTRHYFLATDQRLVPGSWICTLS